MSKTAETTISEMVKALDAMFEDGITELMIKAMMGNSHDFCDFETENFLIEYHYLQYGVIDGLHIKCLKSQRRIIFEDDNVAFNSSIEKAHKYFIVDGNKL